MAKFKGRKSGYNLSLEETPWKPKTKCLACGGSGYYDHNGSPKCGWCNGTGYEPDERKETK